MLVREGAFGLVKLPLPGIFNWLCGAEKQTVNFGTGEIQGVIAVCPRPVNVESVIEVGKRWSTRCQLIEDNRFTPGVGRVYIERTGDIQMMFGISSGPGNDELLETIDLSNSERGSLAACIIAAYNIGLQR